MLQNWEDIIDSFNNRYIEYKFAWDEEYNKAKLNSFKSELGK